MHSHVLRNEENPCLQWLNTQAPDSVLYVAFGSGRSPFTNTQLYELAEGLEASRQPFLWILKIPGEISSPSMQAPQHSMSELLPPGKQLTSFKVLMFLCFVYSGSTLLHNPQQAPKFSPTYLLTWNLWSCIFVTEFLCQLFNVACCMQFLNSPPGKLSNVNLHILPLCLLHYLTLSKHQPASLHNLFDLELVELYFHYRILVSTL